MILTNKVKTQKVGNHRSPVHQRKHFLHATVDREPLRSEYSFFFPKLPTFHVIKFFTFKVFSKLISSDVSHGCEFELAK